MIKDGCRNETIKFAALSGCAYNKEICFVRIDPKSIVFNLASDITETITYLCNRKIFV